MRGERIHGLDGLRGIAAFVVAILYHGWLLAVPAVKTALPPGLAWFAQWGWTFVDLFFVLSGYVFAHVYLRRGGLAYRGDLGDFALARVARLWPLHLIMLGFTALLFTDNPDNSALAFGGQLVMAQAFVGRLAMTFNGPAWSVSVECACYVLFAVAALRGARFAGGAALVLCCLGIALQIPPEQGLGSERLVVLARGLTGFFLGQLLWQARAPLKRVPSLVLCGLFVGAVMIMPLLSNPLLGLSLVAWPSLLLLAVRVPAFDAAPLRWLGDRSYALYMIHGPCFDLIARELGRAQGSWTGALAYVGGMSLLVLLLADLMHRRIERPAGQWIRGLRHRRLARARSALAA